MRPVCPGRSGLGAVAGCGRDGQFLRAGGGRDAGRGTMAARRRGPGAGRRCEVLSTPDPGAVGGLEWFLTRTSSRPWVRTSSRQHWPVPWSTRGTWEGAAPVAVGAGVRSPCAIGVGHLVARGPPAGAASGAGAEPRDHWMCGRGVGGVRVRGFVAMGRWARRRWCGRNLVARVAVGRAGDTLVRTGRRPGEGAATARRPDGGQPYGSSTGSAPGPGGHRRRRAQRRGGRHRGHVAGS